MASHHKAPADHGLSPVQFSRLTRRGVLLGLLLPQLIVLAIGIVTIVAALYAGGGMLLVWSAPIWGLCALLAWVPVGGRRLVEWVPVTVRWMWRVSIGQLDYRRRVVKPRPAGTLALPPSSA